MMFFRCLLNKFKKLLDVYSAHKIQMFEMVLEPLTQAPFKRKKKGKGQNQDQQELEAELRNSGLTPKDRDSVFTE